MTSFQISLKPLSESARENFIEELQRAFQCAAEFWLGPLDKKAISRADIEASLNTPGAQALVIEHNGKTVGGAVVIIDEHKQKNSLDLFFIKQSASSRGLGFAAWQAIEARYPRTKLWRTATPYFDKRNIHFYVNKCGFDIVEFINPHHPAVDDKPTDAPGLECFFRFEKTMHRRPLPKKSKA